MYKQYVAKLKYHLWRLSRAAEFVLRPDEKTFKQYSKAQYSDDLMKATLQQLDRIPPGMAQTDTDPWFVGVIPHEWEKRINERIQKKESNSSSE